MDRSRYLFCGPEHARVTIILAHGAGTGMAHPSMEAIATRLADRSLRTVRFEFPYMHDRARGVRRGPDPAPVLMETWREAITDTGDPKRIVIGGRSMGGRIASMVADASGILGLVCLGYPFHPAGRPKVLRVAHLKDLATPTLILQGTRDQLGLPQEIDGYDLSPSISLHYIGDGDHGFKPRKSSGRTLEQNLDEAADEIARFVSSSIHDTRAGIDVSPSEYERKRRFDRTPEPQGESHKSETARKRYAAQVERARRAAAAGRRRAEPAADGNAPASFVIHRHEARRLHYDLRLHIGGTLCSWAVPKGFSYNPKVRRLAVRTEDHPLEYLDFEGMIPKGEYGAGTIEIWDEGTYTVLKGTPQSAVEEGDLKLLLSGKRVRGEWHLFRTSGSEWLLLKARDLYARDTDNLLPLAMVPERLAPEEIDLAPAPMKPGKSSSPFSDPGWLFELDFEGVRTIAGKHDGTGFVAVDRRGELAHIAAAISALRCAEAVVDGVLVALDDDGRPSRKALEAARKAGSRGGAAAGTAGGAAPYNAPDGDAPAGLISLYLFDILHWDGFSVRDLPLLERKELLKSIVPASQAVLFVDSVAGRGDQLAARAMQSGLGGLIAKEASSPYVCGTSDHWRRVTTAGANHGGAGDDGGAGKHGRPGRAARGSKRGAGSAASPARQVKLTNPEKVYWPDDGITKRDLFAYYDSVAELLVPHLAGRPLHMQRFPNGINGKRFYQRQAPEQRPAWVATVEFAEDDRQVICNDRWTLLYIVNLGSIDIHPWLSRAETPENPDWVVIDIDAKESTFANAVRIARKVGSLLRGLGLRAYLKTSGGTGLHVYVPIVPDYSYDHARMFAEGVARTVAMENREIATVERNPGQRGSKIYVDFLQNRRSATVVPPYCVRPVPGARVSMPLDWDELSVDLTPELFTIRTAADRINATGDLFRPVIDDRQDLFAAIDALAEYAKSRRAR